MSKNLSWPGPGYWIETCAPEYWQYTDEHYMCSSCKKYVEDARKYCPHCGERKLAVIHCTVKIMGDAFDD